MTDEQIIDCLQNRQQTNTAFRMLMSKYQERLYWHIRRLVVSHEDTDDVLQNTFMKVYKNIPSFKSESKLYTWMYRIATNESMTHLKKNRRNSKQEGLESQEDFLNKLESDVGFNGDVITKNLLAAIAILPEKQRLVFQLKYFDELTYKDISEIVGTSEGGLKASYYHASQKIREQLKKVEFLE